MYSMWKLTPIVKFFCFYRWDSVVKNADGVQLAFQRNWYSENVVLRSSLDSDEFMSWELDRHLRDRRPISRLICDVRNGLGRAWISVWSCTNPECREGLRKTRHFHIYSVNMSSINIDRQGAASKGTSRRRMNYFNAMLKSQIITKNISEF